MGKIIEFFIKRDLVVKILLFIIVALSVNAARTTKRNAWPVVDLATVVITTEYPGASPKDVEQNVTRLIEDELKGIAGIEKFTSVSDENVSTIVVNVDLDYPDQEKAITEVQRAVDRVSDLPPEVTKRPEITHLTSSEIPILVIGVSGDDSIPYRDLRSMAKIIERDIRSMDGIAKVDKYAFRDHEFQVNIDPQKLHEYYVSLNDVLFALENRNIRASGGNLESFKTQRNILTMSEFENLDHVRNVIIRSSFTGGTLRVKDIAKVQEGYSKEMMRTTFNGKKGISLIIKKNTNSDIIDIVDKLKKYVSEKQKIMPKGIELSAVNDDSFKVRNRLEVVITNAIAGFFLVFIVLIAFLNLKASFWIAMSIPTALGISLILLPYFGQDLNAVSLAAMIIVLGMLVDDSIVISENIMRHRLLGKTAYQAAYDGTMEVFMPVLATILTTILSFAPMFAMTGVLGRFIEVIPVVVITALLGSLIDAFLILPNHIYHSSANFNESSAGWRGKVFNGISKVYEYVLNKVLRLRYLNLLFSIGFLTFTFWWGGQHVPLNLFPAEGAQVFYIYVELDDSQIFDATSVVIHNIEKEIAKIPDSELKYYTSRIGTDNSDPLAQPIGGQENLAYIKITLTPHNLRDRDVETIIKQLRTVTDKWVKNDKDIIQIRYEIEKPGPPAGTPIELHVHSDNDENREFFVKKIVEDFEAMDGVVDIKTSSKVGRQEFKLDLDYDKLAQVGLTVNDVASTMRIAFDGVNTTSIVKNNEEIDIHVSFPKKYKRNIKNVLELVIRNPKGKLIPIKSFAKLSQIRAETSVHHKDGDVTTTIYAQTSDVSILPKVVIEKEVKKYSPMLKDYPDVSFSYGGEAEKTEESVHSLLVAFAGGVIGIYLLLTLLFNSASQPMLILIAVPFGLIGVIWAFYFHSRPFTFLGLIGVIGLTGVVVNDSLVMIEFINSVFRKFKESGQTFSKNDLIAKVVEGAGQRLRPIIITTVTTVMGLLPTAYGIGGSDPLIEPMVLAIAWGLLFATVLTLFLIPCLYLINEDILSGIKKIINKIKPKSMRSEH